MSPPPHWLERGDPQRQASLIIDPPNGRMPPLTEAGQHASRGARGEREGRGPADSYTDRSLYDRCITRGMVGSLTPAIYNAGNQIVQSPGYVVITNEMIHEARVIPLDGRPPLGPAIKQWVGDSRGHFEGDTLVVETTNFTDRTNVGQARHSDKLKMTERYTRIDDDTLVLRLTVEDPETWSGAVDARAAATARRQLRHVRVRVPRGQSRDVQHPERPPRRRARGGGAALAPVSAARRASRRLAR